MMQPEFSFAQPYIEAQQKRDDNFRKWITNLWSPEYAEVMRNIFKSMPSFEDWDGPSIPMTIVLGQTNQYEFDFVIPIDKAAWPNYPIEYAVREFFDVSKQYRRNCCVC